MLRHPRFLLFQGTQRLFPEGLRSDSRLEVYLSAASPDIMGLILLRHLWMAKLCEAFWGVTFLEEFQVFVEKSVEV